MVYLICSVIILMTGMYIIYTDYKIKNYTFTGATVRKTKKMKAGAIHYYRIYKNIYMQLMIGIGPFEMMRRLYLMTDHKSLRALLMEMSEIVTNSNDIDKGIKFLKNRLADDDSKIFISILENGSKTGFSLQSMKQLDHFFFQKYLIGISTRVKQVKRKYFIATFLFCSAIFISIFMPVLNQMLVSLKSIFNSY